MKYIRQFFPLSAIVVLGLAGCKGEMESQDEQKMRENEQQIQAYAQTNGLTPQKSESGLYYQIRPGGSTRKAQVGEQVVLRIIGRRLDGFVFDSTSLNSAKTARAQYGFIGLAGLQEGLSLMNVSDSATLLMPYYLAYGSRSFDVLPAYSPVRYDIKLLAIRNETEQIDAYLLENKLEPTVRTTDGLVLVRTVTTTGAQPQSGQTARVSYVVRSLTGVEYDKGIIDVRIGANGSIKGFEEGIKLLRVGEKGRILFPSALGYGTQGYQTIPGYTPLVFDVELMSVQ
jgi:FKBP-type peptidyl-prolyl cis-trans isomerase